MTGAGVDAVLFDKDGTLFDFSATWDVWALSALEALSSGDAALMQALADAAGYDIAAQRFHPTSLVIAGTSREAAEALALAVPDRSVDAIEAVLTDLALEAPLTPAVPLAPLLDSLTRAGVALGVMTNDAEVAARAHLGSAGVLDRFAFIAGFDSGHGAKPSPTPLLAFADAVGRDPAQVAMVGDSTHDLVAGRAAGMRTVGVLTGPATRADLAPLADVVLPDIGHLPGWLGMA